MPINLFRTYVFRKCIGQHFMCIAPLKASDESFLHSGANARARARRRPAPSPTTSRRSKGLPLVLQQKGGGICAVDHPSGALVPGPRPPAGRDPPGGNPSDRLPGSTSRTPSYRGSGQGLCSSPPIGSSAPHTSRPPRSGPWPWRPRPRLEGRWHPTACTT